MIGQCRKPSGPLGRIVLWVMNRRHSPVTNWGLTHVEIHATDTILDVGCGGGRTLAKLAAAARQGSAHGIDFSSESVAAAARVNQQDIAAGRVTVQQASVSEIPFPQDTFDLVTAVETHFWWDDPERGLRECLRVLKPGGHLALIAEFYDGGPHVRYARRLVAAGMSVWNVEEHRALLTQAGFTDVTSDEETRKGWLSVVGRKP